MTAMLNDLHFLRPLWLLALPPAWLMVWWLARRNARGGDWSRVIDADLLPALLLDRRADGRSGWPAWPWLALAWTLAALALAGPSWQRTAAPAYRASSAWMLVLDLSPSMAAADLAPSRAARARYAIGDILDAAHDARVGLVAFSDEPYTVTPLTQDVDTIRTLLPSLAPGIMPSQGDALAPALAQAQKLLQASGAAERHIVVLSDGVGDAATALSTAAALKAQGISISVLGVGTEAGAPVRGADGHFTLDAQGHPAMARLDAASLRQLARTGGGVYAGVGDASAVIASLQPSRQSAGASAGHGAMVDKWRDAGVYLLPALLCLAALLARRNWL